MRQAGMASCIKFGLFDINLQTGELRKQGLKLKLGRNALRVMELLLQHPGELLTREDIRQTLWGGGTFVTFDRGINKAIHELRQALGDSSNNPNYIETVPSRGYRFIYSPEAAGQQNRNDNLHSIAILPFATEPADRETELFNKTVVERIIDLVAQEPGLTVLAYSTVQHYRGEDLNPEAIRKNLGVRIAALGELTRSQDKLLLHVELVDVWDGTQLWGGQFTRSFARMQVAPVKLADQIWDRVRPILILKARKRNENEKIYQVAA
jgi:DNA-binding winged helix-turn-helix (wHTH) protein